ncbi:MAG: hypothetical protein EBU93_07020, partial [Chlamydiae bacterium]|nr:hypothetical protein [Chlamydiota bacterium]
SGTFPVGDIATLKLRLEISRIEYSIEIHGIAGPRCGLGLPNLRDACFGIISGIEEKLGLAPDKYNPLAYGEQKAFQKQ